MSEALQYIFAGITVGSIYAIVAIGFNLIYNTTGIINFAQGEFVMLGGMTAVTLATFLPLPLAIAGAIVVVMLCGGAVELLLFRRLRNPGALQMIVITIGLSIIVREVALHVWDEKVRSLPYFTGDECSSVKILDAGISPQVFWVLGTVVIAVIVLHCFLRFSIAGKAMRACASNPSASMLAGINTSTVRTLTFMVSAGLGALGGCVMSPISMTQYDMGTSLAIKGFAAAILGGLGNHLGALAAGLLVGLAEKCSVHFLPAAYQDAIAFFILLFVLVVRPHGLFGSKSAAALRD